jgi:hypothetical protein
MNIKKVIAATTAAASLGIGGLVVAGSASAAPAASTNPAATVTAPVKGHHSLRRQVRRGIVVVSAKAIGITPKALVAELKTGTSIAEVAAAHHVDVTTVVTDLVNAGNQRIDRAVSNGKITTARAAALKARLPALAQRAVDFKVTPR